MTRSGALAGALACAVLFGVLLAPAPAGAAGYLFRADTTAQGYRLRDVWGRAIDRRRLTQRLNMGLYQLVPGQNLTFEGSFRADFDLGVDEVGITTDTGTGTNRQVADEGEVFEELDERRFDLLYAYLRYQDPGEYVDIQAGRLVQLDALSYTSFDGISASVTLPFHLGIQAMAGTLVRDGVTTGWYGFEPDGVDEMDTVGIVTGAGLSLERLGWATAQATWRRILDDGEESQHKLAATMNVDWLGLDLVQTQALLEYDIFNERVSEARARVQGHVYGPYGVAAGYRHFVPSFAGDSIWNLFTISPYDEVRGEVFYLDPNNEQLQIEAAYVLRMFHNDEETSDGLPVRDAGFESGAENHGAEIYGRYALGPRSFVDLELRYGEGYGGDLFLIMPGVDLLLFDRRLDLSARASVLYTKGDLQRSGTYWTYAGWLEGMWHIDTYARLGTLLEGSYNDAMPGMIRVYLMLELEFGG